MTVVRITIKKTLNLDVYAYQQTAKSAFSSEYLVQTGAPFSSPQLEAYALDIAQAESRLYPSCVRFYQAMIKLATPGASSQELRGQFFYVDMDKICGQVEMAQDDVLAFPPVAAVFGRNAGWGNGGRLILPHVLTATEWSLYHHKRVVPLRFRGQDTLNQLSQTPDLSFSRALIEAVGAENGAIVLPSVAADSDHRLRQVNQFVWTGFQLGPAKPKRKKAKKAPRRASLEDDETETDAAPTPKKPKAPVPGVVYLLKAGGHFKIGMSTNPDKRIGQIKLQLPYPVEVVHVIRAANPLAAEAHWHRRFASLRQNGEWFLLSDAEVSEFKSVSEM